MLTQCPHCLAVFRLQAQQLVVARGFVVCGACEQVCLALDRLADEAARPAPEPPAVRRYPDDEKPLYPLTEASALLDGLATAEVADRVDTVHDIPAVLRADFARLQQPRAARTSAAWSAFAALLLLVFAVIVLSSPVPASLVGHALDERSPMPLPLPTPPARCCCSASINFCVYHCKRRIVTC